MPAEPAAWDVATRSPGVAAARRRAEQALQGVQRSLALASSPPRPRKSPRGSHGGQRRAENASGHEADAEPEAEPARRATAGVQARNTRARAPSPRLDHGAEPGVVCLGEAAARSLGAAAWAAAQRADAPELARLVCTGKGVGSVDAMPPSLRACSALLLGGNAIRQLKGLRQFRALRQLSLANNDVRTFGELRHLSEKHLPLLRALSLEGNPLSHRQAYRERVLARLPGLAQLDGWAVQASERKDAVDCTQLRLRLVGWLARRPHAPTLSRSSVCQYLIEHAPGVSGAQTWTVTAPHVCKGHAARS